MTRYDFAHTRKAPRRSDTSFVDLKVPRLYTIPSILIITVYKFTDIYQELPIPRKFFFTHLPAELINLERIKESNSKVNSLSLRRYDN